MDQSTNRFLALAVRPSAPLDKAAYRKDTPMHERVFLPRTAPETHRAIRDLDATIQRGGLDKTLIELVTMRASQINGCAFCLDMHAKDALTPAEIANLTALIGVINIWNRVAVGLAWPMPRAA
jgi:AhpD family alkylhydroperoxidase